MILTLILACSIQLPAEIPGPTLGADEWARALNEGPAAGRFDSAFRSGEQAGLQTPLADLLAWSALLSPVVQEHFLDGASHSWQPVGVGVDAILAELAIVPPRFRPLFQDGALIAAASACDAEPTHMVPLALEWEQATGALPLNGVRIGLQRALGDDLPSALGVAASYPDDWHPALFEELGWRAGDDAWRWSGGICDRAGELSEGSRCSFVQGAARGHAMKHPWRSEAEGRRRVDAMTRDSCGCDAHLWVGLGWALHLGGSGDRALTDTQIAWLPVGATRDSVQATLRSLDGPGQPPPWSTPAPPI